jgi:hypothetical protein
MHITVYSVHKDKQLSVKNTEYNGTKQVIIENSGTRQQFLGGTVVRTLGRLSCLI